jgi:hypothetical protein
MKFIIILGFLYNHSLGQIYGTEYPNTGPDHGNSRNFSGSNWNGVSHVLSELNINGEIYSYVYQAEGDFRVFRKNGEKFIELANVSKTDMGESTKLLYVYKDSATLNIFSWIPRGYNFVSLKKNENQNFQLTRHVLIQNLNHCTLGKDPSIKALQFEGPNQMRILKTPSEEYPETELLFEIRPDGVYRNGIWDRTVMDYEDPTVIDEKLKTDPDYFEKLRQAREARLANDPQLKAQTKQPGVGIPIQQPKLPETKPTSIVTAPSLPKPVAPAAVPVMTQNLIPWLAGLVAVLVFLLGYLGLRYIRKRS